VLPLALMYIGILIRIGAYGFTEPRYFVLILGIWVTAFTAMAIFQRPEKRFNVLAPTLLAALAVLAVLGPWSAFNVSLMSQTARFESILVRNSMLSADCSTIVPKKDIPEGDKASLYSILDYFNNRQTPDALHRLPSDFSMDKAPGLLGFDRPISIGGPQQQGIYINMSEPLGTLDVGDYDFIYFGEKGAFNGQSGQGEILASMDSNSVFTITHDGKAVYQKDLKDYAKTYIAAYSPSKTYTLEDLTQRDDTDTVAVKYIFTNISTNLRDGTTEYYITPYCVMFRIK
jgi:hypothetical protein